MSDWADKREALMKRIEGLGGRRGAIEVDGDEAAMLVCAMREAIAGAGVRVGKRVQPLKAHQAGTVEEIEVVVRCDCGRLDRYDARLVAPVPEQETSDG